MRRLILPQLAILISCIILVTGTGSAATYYIAATGSDSNNGTSKGTPWRHAPGMPNATGIPAGYSPASGDKFILRGGDIYHVSASTNDSTDTAMGGTWTWTWSGSSSSCNYPSTTTTCIYLGTDQTWYAGSSFVRPVVTFDNPIWASSTRRDSSHNGFVTSCTYDDYNSTAIYLNANYVQLDNIEFTGKCWTQVPTFFACAEVARTGTYIDVTNIYVHGWTETYNPQPNGQGPMDQCAILSGRWLNPPVTHNVVAYSVFSGNDTVCTAYGACTGGPVEFGEGYDFHDNVVEYIANALGPYNAVTVHDNLFRYIYESYDPADHGSVFEALAPSNEPAGTPFSFYNNLIHDTDIGETVETVNAPNGGPVYMFNNVFYNIGHAPNCVYVEQSSGSTDTATSFYFVNNTVDSSSGCVMRISGGSGGTQYPFYGTVYFQNNHFIGLSGGALAGFYNAGSTALAVTDNGNEVFQSESVANSQGYTASDGYAPTSSGDATIGAGANLASLCSTFSPDLALCSGTTGGVSYDAANHVAAANIGPSRPASGAGSWGAEAYFLSGTSISPPTSLTATVQ